MVIVFTTSGLYKGVMYLGSIGRLGSEIAIEMWMSGTLEEDEAWRGRLYARFSI